MPLHRAVLRGTKLLLLHITKYMGASRAILQSRWRQSRLAILCYHGVSIDDEHLWRPGTFVSPEFFRSRMEILRTLDCSVLDLSAAVRRLRAGTLPKRSVVLTFDDGNYDFYARAYPILREFGFPATVYLTSYYSQRGRPVFPLICSYILWKAGPKTIRPAGRLGTGESYNLAIVSERERLVAHVASLATQYRLSGADKDTLTSELARSVGIDYVELCQRRNVQLMRAEEVRELSAAGIDFQLHTHRHRVPLDAALFAREIRENRQYVESLSGRQTTHFCYPSGVYRGPFLDWLKREGVESATTCELALAGREHNLLLLPRILDDSHMSAIEFESWLTGAAAILSRLFRVVVPRRPLVPAVRIT